MAIAVERWIWRPRDRDESALIGESSSGGSRAACHPADPYAACGNHFLFGTSPSSATARPGTRLCSSTKRRTVAFMGHQLGPRKNLSEHPSAALSPSLTPKFRCAALKATSSARSLAPLEPIGADPMNWRFSYCMSCGSILETAQAIKNDKKAATNKCPFCGGRARPFNHHPDEFHESVSFVTKEQRPPTMASFERRRAWRNCRGATRSRRSSPTNR